MKLRLLAKAEAATNGLVAVGIESNRDTRAVPASPIWSPPRLPGRRR
jgi:hypothetical protein